MRMKYSRLCGPNIFQVVLQKYGADVSHRLEELKQCTVHDGLRKVQAHFDDLSQPGVEADRNAARDELEGQDVFWDGPAQVRKVHAAATQPLSPLSEATTGVHAADAAIHAAVGTVSHSPRCRLGRRVSPCAPVSH
jgi:hypothetical protein